MLSNAIEHKEEGNRLFAKQDYQKALEQYELAIICDPTLAAAWLNKGITLKKLSNNEEAILAFEKVLTLNEDYHKARQYLVATLLAQKKYSRAWPHFAKLNNPSQELQMGYIKCQQNIGAKIIFANVDLKFTNDNSVKILEFGDGMASGFSGFDILSPDGKTISDLLASTLCEFIEPIPMEEDSTFHPIFLNAQPGIRFSSEIIDTKLTQFIQESKVILPKKELSPEKIRNHCAIYGGNDLIPTPVTVLKLGDIRANFIFSNKILMHRCFMNAGLMDSRPITLIMPRQYHSELYAQIVTQLPNFNQFVLKVPDKERGEGVIIVDKKGLDQYLKILLCPKEHFSNASGDFANYVLKETGLPFRLLQKELLHINSWRSSDESEFMIEAYVPSKPVKKEGNLYDGTMRVAFILVCEEGNFRFIPMGAYWKLPPNPMVQGGSLRESCVSSFSETHLLSALPQKADEKEVFRQLNVLLPLLFEDILQFDAEKYIKQFPANNDEEKNFKSVQWLKLSNHYIMRGELVMAHHYLKYAENLTPTSRSYYHQLGVYYHANKEYDKALSAFDSAIEKDPRIPATFLRRGSTCLKKNAVESAVLAFKKASELNPEYTELIKHLLSRYFEENEEKQREQMNVFSLQSSYTHSI